MEQTHETHQGAAKTYIIGFILSIILTVIAFWLVREEMITGKAASFIILSLAVVQLLVQLLLFLHMGDETKPRYYGMSTAYAFMTIIIFVVGSIWIMFSLDHFGSGHSTGLKQRGIDHEVHESK